MANMYLLDWFNKDLKKKQPDLVKKKVLFNHENSRVDVDLLEKFADSIAAYCEYMFLRS